MIGARSILEAFNRHGCRYVVIGMLGATFQGSPLRTDDLDVCPDGSEENLERLAHALSEIEAREWDPHKGEVVERPWSAETLKVDSLWILRTAYGHLDLLFEPAGTGGYEDLERDAVIVEVDDLQITVASIESIIRMKEAAGREKDLGQLPTLRRLAERIAEQGPASDL